MMAIISIKNVDILHTRLKSVYTFQLLSGAQNFSYLVCNRDRGMGTKNFAHPTFIKVLTGKRRMPYAVYFLKCLLFSRRQIRKMTDNENPFAVAFF